MNVQSRSRRWDPVVKLTHWSIVLAILANAVITEEGSAAHIWVGYALAGILGLRLLWGLVGSAEARFSAFLPSARRAIAHVREIRGGKVSVHASHNPLGTLMVYAIWACLLVIIGTGIAMAGLPGSGESREPVGTATMEYAAPEAIERGEDEHDDETGEHEESALTEVHEVAANLLYVLILLHIAGVLFETRRSGRYVVLAMLPGRW